MPRSVEWRVAEAVALCDLFERYATRPDRLAVAATLIRDGFNGTAGELIEVAMT